MHRREYGGIPERPNGADCKSVVFDFGGSNPPTPTKKSTHLGAFFGGIRLVDPKKESGGLFRIFDMISLSDMRGIRDDSVTR